MPAQSNGVREFEPAWLELSLDRYLAWGLGFMFVLIVAFPIYRLREASLRSDAKIEQQTNYIVSGGASFEQNCSTCHGAAGSGGSTAPTLASKQFLTTTSDQQIEMLVAGGVSGSSMTAWSQDFGGPLTSEQIRELVTFLRSLEPDAPSIPDWRTGARARG